MKRAVLIGLFLAGSIGIGACQDQAKTSGESSSGERAGEKGNEPGPVRTACKDEIEKFCPGEKRAGRCLRERGSADLSPACSTALANRGTSR